MVLGFFFSSSVKSVIGIWMGIIFIYIYICNIKIIKILILILPSHECEGLIPLYAFFHFLHQCFVIFIIEIFHFLAKFISRSSFDSLNSEITFRISFSVTSLLVYKNIAALCINFVSCTHSFVKF